MLLPNGKDGGTGVTNEGRLFGGVVMTTAEESLAGIEEGIRLMGDSSQRSEIRFGSINYCIINNNFETIKVQFKEKKNNLGRS